jgi:hypothetical protein
LVVGPNTSNFLIGHFISYGTGCYPSTTELTSSDWDAYYYSPAICPSGWNIATSLTSVLSGPAMGPGTSGYLCCPLKHFLIVVPLHGLILFDKVNTHKRLNLVIPSIMVWDEHINASCNSPVASH